MGSLVDGLARSSLNPDENGASSKDQPFSRNACSIEKKPHGKKSDENAKEKSRIIQLFSTDMEPTSRLQRIQNIFRHKTQRKSAYIHCKTVKYVAGQRDIFDKENLRH
jgi:hypothetical protein